jgi:hypothetical protein
VPISVDLDERDLLTVGSNYCRIHRIRSGIGDPTERVYGGRRSFGWAHLVTTISEHHQWCVARDCLSQVVG